MNDKTISTKVTRERKRERKKGTKKDRMKERKKEAKIKPLHQKALEIRKRRQKRNEKDFQNEEGKSMNNKN